ncbi:proliferation-associated protein 2G4-like [Paramacrobiotus metropolitanus]|uniref:proliferation-associated protein 2G4-like n=1 Tax=Paramacrobiotus metropolitanus TaxID=2943436 RepID=UPI0024459B5E|nr:proliferation-associated protein 2G4-like [Paramacrobiotus metropolitanus]
MSSGSRFDEPEECSVANVAVLNKYKSAGQIANRIALWIAGKCIPDAAVVVLCELSDRGIVRETAKVFQEEAMRKGVAFPTCISVNNYVAYYSPTAQEASMGEGVLLQDGDLVKIDLAVHIDGYIASVGYSCVVGASQEKPVSGRKADGMWAAQTALKASMRLIKPGVTNYQVTALTKAVITAYGCQPIEGTVSHQLLRNQLEAEKSIIQNPNQAHKRKYKKTEFEENEVYAVDVLASTGDGKPTKSPAYTTIFRKLDVSDRPRNKTQRAMLAEASTQYDTMAFHVRNLGEEWQVSRNTHACINAGLLKGYPVLTEKTGDLVAQCKGTVAVTATGVEVISGLLVLTADKCQSDHAFPLSEMERAQNNRIETNKKNGQLTQPKAEPGQDAVSSLEEMVVTVTMPPNAVRRGRPKKAIKRLTTAKCRFVLPSAKRCGRYSKKEKRQAVVVLRQYPGAAGRIANRLRVDRHTLLEWNRTQDCDET